MTTAVKRRWVRRECLICGKSFNAAPSKVRAGHGRFCSQKCNGANRTKRLLAMPLIDRLLDVVRKNNATGCWEWTGHCIDKGYGQIGVGGGYKSTHRLSYELFCGHIPDGLLVMHSCDNPPCCNPVHLRLGTNLDNIHDSMRKGRWQHGVRNGRSKLTPEKVVEIRQMVANGVTRNHIAKHLGLDFKTVHNAVTGRTWHRVQGAGS